MAETDYPKVIESCPMCDWPERVVEREVNEQKALGRILPERIPCSTQKLIAIRDPLKTTLSFPVLLLHFDHCAQCGFEYPHIITRQVMTFDQFQTLYMQLAGMTPVGKG